MGHDSARPQLTRREFTRAAGFAAAPLPMPLAAGSDMPEASHHSSAPLTAADLPAGSAPLPVPLPHFPDRLHAFVWRNWQLVPPARMAAVVGATPEQITALGHSM